jgi:hypothetical protein
MEDIQVTKAHCLSPKWEVRDARTTRVLINQSNLRNLPSMSRARVAALALEVRLAANTQIT